MKKFSNGANIPVPEWSTIDIPLTFQILFVASLYPPTLELVLDVILPSKLFNTLRMSRTDSDQQSPANLTFIPRISLGI